MRSRRNGLRLAFLLLVAVGAARAARQEEPPLEMGAGSHRYAWDPDWPSLPGGAMPGNTHGGIVVDGQGRILVNTDTEEAVMVFAEDGTHLRSFGAALAGGLHGMVLRREEGEERLICAHTALGVVAVTLEGQERWRLEAPQEPGIYSEEKPWHPTSVAYAPGGDLFVADGYGQSFVHHYDSQRRWLQAIGGPGEEPGRFHTPHGIAIDTRGDEPVLLVADRENSRLQSFTLDGQPVAVLAEDVLRRPCSLALRGEFLVVADLCGRVTILDGDDRVVAQLGDNPDRSQWANNGVPRADWRDGIFLAPHFATWDAHGDLYVLDWNQNGRVVRLERLP